MDNYTSVVNVRARLIIAGLTELEQHGAADFSLRRVAKEAGVSCAAPYRHFKDKDDLVRAVIEYVLEGWTLLSGQLETIFASDIRALISELSVAGLRFWIANGNFRTVIMASGTLGSGERGALSSFDAPIKQAVDRYAAEWQIVDSELLSFKILSMLYGAIILVDGGYEATEHAAERLREAIASEIL